MCNRTASEKVMTEWLKCAEITCVGMDAQDNVGEAVYSELYSQLQRFVHQ